MRKVSPQELFDNSLKSAHVADLVHQMPQFQIALEPQSVVSIFSARNK